MGVQIIGAVGPVGSAKRIKLEGDSFVLNVVDVDQEQGLNEVGELVSSDFLSVTVLYPDGYTRQHQVKDIHGLLAQITGQLKGRYNLASFDFIEAPNELVAGTVIVTGGNQYDA